jgi:uncharacterized protein YjbI with pentapeptide repeats
MYVAESSRPLEELQALAEAANKGVKKRKWFNEGFHLSVNRNQLVGSTKLFSDSVSDEDLRAAGSDVDYVIALLQRLARKHGLVWHISCGEDLGTIDADRIDPRVMEFSRAFGAADDILDPIPSKPSKPMARRPTLLPKKQIAALRERWSPERLATLRPLIEARDRADLVAFCGEYQGLIDLRGLNLKVFSSHHDRRSLPTLTGCDFSHCHTPDSSWTPKSRAFRDCRFDGAVFTNLVNGDFQSCSFICSTFDDMHAYASFNDCDFTHTRFNRFKLSSTVLFNCRFTHCRMRKAELGGSRFIGCDFNEADLAGAALGGSAFIACSFTGSIFTGACYLHTIFKTCSGLDATRMEVERWSVLGEYISEFPIVINDLDYPDHLATLSGPQPALMRETDYKRHKQIDDLCKRDRIELFPSFGEDLTIAESMSDAQIDQMMIDAQDVANSWQVDTTTQGAAKIIRDFSAKLQIIYAWIDQQPEKDHVSIQQRRKRVFAMIGLGLQMIECYQQRLSASLAGTT